MILPSDILVGLARPFYGVILMAHPECLCPPSGIVCYEAKLLGVIPDRNCV